MKDLYSTVEIEAWEANSLAIENAIARVKSRLADAPEGVLADVRDRCDPDTHADLIDWIGDKVKKAHPLLRLPAVWSPKHNRRLWILYTAANLKCPDDPPTT